MKTHINRARRLVMKTLTSNIGSQSSAEEISSMIGNNRKIERILVIRANSRLGNQLLLTPLLQELPKHFPGCRIDLFVRGNVASIVFANYAEIDRIIKLPPKPFKQLGSYVKVWLSIRKHRYDMVINVAGGSSSGRLLTKISRAAIKLFGDDLPEVSALYTDYAHHGKKTVYNLRHFLNSRKDLPVPSLSLKLNDEEVGKGRRLLEKMASGKKLTICIYTFATGDKCYAREWWERLYTQLKTRYGNGYDIVEVLPKENVSQIDFKATTYYSTDLREMGAVMANSVVFITADCGIMHLASSVGVPTVGLFSVTNSSVYAPYNSGSVAVDTSGITPEDVMHYIDSIMLRQRDVV